MAQIQKGDTFVDGQQVTGARLNQLIDSAILLPNAITDQTALSAKTVAVDDAILAYDTSSSALRKVRADDIVGSNIPVITSSVTAGNGSDISITPNDGTLVTGSAYVGTTTNNIVTSNAHGLIAGQVILVSSATGSQYNGTYKIDSVTTNTFTYSTNGTVIAGSGTLSYIKKGSLINSGNNVIAGSNYITGDSKVNGNLTVVGNSNITGNLTVLGASKVALTTDSTAVTQTATNSSTAIATTAFVNAWNPIKAWVNFNGNGTSVGSNLTINAGFNVTSVVYNGTGDYTINFTSAISDANYCVNATLTNPTSIGSSGSEGIICVYGDGSKNPVLKTTTQLRIASQTYASTLFNSGNISVLIIR